MPDYKTGCLVCGEELIYEKTEKMECYYCHKIYESNVRCKNGHFICDKCHSSAGNELIENFCITTKLEDPMEIALILMRNPTIKMHGPEHHFLIPAVLLASYYNTRKNYEEKEAKRRSSNILGGFCGFYGDCGAAVGTGIFVSLVTNSTPLSVGEWRLSNLMTAKSLLTIANHGGPRCCKRNTDLAIKEAVNFVKLNLDTAMKTKKKMLCEFSDSNKGCLKQKCPYYPKRLSLAEKQ